MFGGRSGAGRKEYRWKRASTSVFVRFFGKRTGSSASSNSTSAQESAPAMAVSALYPVPHTRTARAHVTVAAAVAAGDDAASAAAEEADDAERPTPPLLPLMPRGMDADAAMPMPGSRGSRCVEREPGAAVCAPAPNFELLL
jgi:hypothetical protein